MSKQRVSYQKIVLSYLFCLQDFYLRQEWKFDLLFCGDYKQNTIQSGWNTIIFKRKSSFQPIIEQKRLLTHFLYPRKMQTKMYLKRITLLS